MKKIFTFLLGCIVSLNVMAADLPTILGDDDASLYRQIFDLQSREKIDAAMRLDNKITDSILMGEVLYQRYISKTYRTRGHEINTWMTKYYNTPGAPRMAALAKIKQTTVRSPKLPNTISGTSIETARRSNKKIQTRHPQRQHQNRPFNSGRRPVQA